MRGLYSQYFFPYKSIFFKGWKFLLLFFVLNAYSSFSSAYFLVGIQPSSTVVEKIKIIQNLESYLSDELGDEVKVEWLDNWTLYRKSIFDHKYDALIVEPHLASLVVESHGRGGAGHTAIVVQERSISYVVVTTTEININHIKELKSRTVCTVSSPSLGGVLLLNHFLLDPINPPKIIETKIPRDDGLEYLFKGKCDALVIDKSMLPVDEKNYSQLKVIHEFTSYPGWTVTIKKVHGQSIISLLEDAFLKSGEDLEMLNKTLIGGKTTYIETDDTKYKDHNILPGVVWGW